MKGWININKIIAIDIDDTINNFSEVLQNLEVKYEEYSYMNKETFDKYLDLVKKKEYPDEQYLDDYISFMLPIHKKCYSLAEARQDAVEFIQWLHANDWRIVFLTYRDLRRVLGQTKQWLDNNKIPYDFLFHVVSQSKTVFCKFWKIDYLIDDAQINVITAPEFGIKTYYLINNENTGYETAAYGFKSFDELYSKFEGLA